MDHGGYKEGPNENAKPKEPPRSRPEKPIAVPLGSKPAPTWDDLSENFKRPGSWE